MRRFCCPLECGSLQVVTATRYTRSSINRFIDRARVGDAGRRARNRRHTRVGEGGLELVLGVGLGLGEILVMGLAWPWGNPRYGSWPWENPRNDFLAILHSKDQHLLNYMNMNLCCKEEKHLERDHGFSTACLSMTSHYVPVTVD